MIDLEALKQKYTESSKSASAYLECAGMLMRDFPALVAKLEAAQRLRDAVVGHFGTEGILKWPEIAGSVVAFNRADKEQQ